jgi:hypothetical protein
MRQEFAKGTWLDPEELCYPSGSISAGRKAKALCSDGRVRTCQVGIPDTFFSIPARTKAFGRSVTGYCYMSEHWEDDVVIGNDAPVLRFTADGKYRELFCKQSHNHEEKK